MENGAGGRFQARRRQVPHGLCTLGIVENAIEVFEDFGVGGDPPQLLVMMEHANDRVIGEGDVKIAGGEIF